jgi:hypothetical protein
MRLRCSRNRTQLLRLPHPARSALCRRSVDVRQESFIRGRTGACRRAPRRSPGSPAEPGSHFWRQTVVASTSSVVVKSSKPFETRIRPCKGTR